MAWCPHCNDDRPIRRNTFEGKCPVCGDSTIYQKMFSVREPGSHIPECRGPVNGAFDVCTYCGTSLFSKAKDKVDYDQCLVVERAATLPRDSSSFGCFKQCMIALLGFAMLGSCSQSNEKSKENPSISPATSNSNLRENQVIPLSTAQIKLKGIVNTPSGVSLRETPGKDSTKSGGVANMQEFEILDLDGPADTIENKSGRWIKIKHADKVGWVFDGFIKIQAENETVSDAE